MLGKMLEKIRRFFNSYFVRSFAHGVNAAHIAMWTL